MSAQRSTKEPQRYKTKIIQTQIALDKPIEQPEEMKEHMTNLDHENYMRIQLRIEPDYILQKLSKLLSKFFVVDPHWTKPSRNEERTDIHVVKIFKLVASKLGVKNSKGLQMMIIDCLKKLGFVISRMMYINGLKLIGA